MSIRNLEALYAPSSVAVIGASSDPSTVGGMVMRNLMEGGFNGPVMPVTKSVRSVAGVLAYPSVADLPLAPDLAVICSATTELPGLVSELGTKGTKACLVMAFDLEEQKGPDGQDLLTLALEAARPSMLRLLGPGSIGFMVPGIGLNASYFQSKSGPGKVAFISRSTAMCTTVLDWAQSRDIGFTHFISLGDKGDVDFGDTIDYLSVQPEVRSILLHIDNLNDARKFLSAARSAARNKPVIAIKAGRSDAGAQAAFSHTGRMAGEDSVYDIAIKRAGMLRVFTLEELFSAVETLANTRRPLRGENLAVLGNGGGLSVMAVDELFELGGHLATLPEDTCEALKPLYRNEDDSSRNPVVLPANASPEQYAQALDALCAAKGVDAVLVMYAPSAFQPAEDIAKGVVEVAEKRRTSTIFTCFAGGPSVAKARAIVTNAQIPHFETPDDAITGFMHMVDYRRNQVMLMETPPSLPAEFTPNTKIARQVIDDAIAKGHLTMSDPEAKAVFAAYGILTVETRIAESPEQAGEIAEALNCPVALKILSNQVTHKTDVGGVVLDLEGKDAVIRTAQEMAQRVTQTFDGAEIIGFTVQRMARRPGAHELIVGATVDPVFGPVILFGEGGTAVEVIKDRAVALPPLNMALARDLVSRTRIFNKLKGYRDRPAADIDSICLTLIQIAQITVDFPEIAEMEINPLFADTEGVIAVDARIRVDPGRTKGPHRMAIRPYPKQLEEDFTMRDGRTVLLRPIRPDDEPRHHELISKLTPEDIRFRFFGLVKELPHDQMARLTQIDYAREMAFVAVLEEEGRLQTLGVVRAVTDPDNDSTEFSVVVRSDLDRSGLGRALMNKIIAYCRERRTRVMVGEVLTDNRRMLKFCETLGFVRKGYIDDDVVKLELDLTQPPKGA